MTIPADMEYLSLQQIPANEGHVYSSVAPPGRTRVFGKVKRTASIQRWRNQQVGSFILEDRQAFPALYKHPKNCGVLRQSYILPRYISGCLAVSAKHLWNHAYHNILNTCHRTTSWFIVHEHMTIGAQIISILIARSVYIISVYMVNRINELKLNWPSNNCLK